MDLYLFHHDLYEYYYNCSMHSTEEWNSFGVKRTNIGVFSIVVGVVCIALYIPCAKTMLRPQLWKLPCYKLMFLNAIIDIWGIINSCFLSGYLSIEGVVFCSYPDFQYIYSTIILSLWGAQCVTVLILAFNRCVEFWQNPTLTAMFEGKRMIFWYTLPVIWFFANLMYVAACPFTTIVNMWMIDPYMGIPGINADKAPYENVVILNMTNLLTFLGLSSCYIFLVFSIWYKRRLSGSVTLSKVQRQVSIQACLICSIIYMCGGMYVFFEFFPQYALPIFLTMDFFCWQWGFCGVILIYMFMNKTLRHGVIESYMHLFGYQAQPAPMSLMSHSNATGRMSTIHPTVVSEKNLTAS
ncbi:hypothetical protein QR680_015794 [Steinernema hermaphroditum]|uniref:Uncharacterized protein n=1 Tax=Steinernema hermaphroditum TaxID=289476 RepID=A0AA39H8Z8_9BILA|nr:hypothetical protein QR680_015794 [Steinernema hermaphroditum]